MIVNQHIEGWKIVSHYAHGLLAGKIAAQLDDSLKKASWVDTLTAVIEHDDHILDFKEQNYLSPAGAPLDFTLSSGTDEEILEHAQRVYNNAAQKSQLIALLVGRHLSFLNESLAADFAKMNDFLDEIKELRKKQRKIYSLTKKDEDALYNLLRFCDRCSLILCQEKIPEGGRSLEINKTIDGKTYHISRDENDVIHIDPWCFQQKNFTIVYEYRILKKTAFKTNKELKESLENAPVQLEEMHFSK